MRSSNKGLLAVCKLHRLSSSECIKDDIVEAFGAVGAVVVPIAEVEPMVQLGS